jgi:ABC-type multidrug transport system ATPase subunit
MSNNVIAVENLSKSYLVGHQYMSHESHTTLRDVIAREARNFTRKTLDFVRGRQIVQGDEVEEFWALRDVSFEVKRGEVVLLPAPLRPMMPDAAFQRKCMGKMSDVTQQGRTILLVSHNMPAVLNICSKGLLLSAGRVCLLGNASDCVRQYMKEVTEMGNTALNLRTDRTGNGSVRFIRAYFANNTHSIINEVRSGDDITVVIELENNTGANLTRFHLAASIRDPSQNMNVICYLSSATQRNDFEYIPYSKVFRIGIRIPKFQVVPGRYTMNLYSEVQNDLADWIQGAVTFDVQPGDYYGTGRLQAAEYQGQFFPDYTMKWLKIDPDIS